MYNFFNGVFKGKTVLVTGHTGFKGSWLSIWLRELGANVIGYALPPNTEDDNFVVSGIGEKIKSNNIGDIRDIIQLEEVFAYWNPEIVFHLAAQPLVRLSYILPKTTYDVNVGGTVNLLECCRLNGRVKVIINVTSDKCYENGEWIWGYRENDRLGGVDPYSSSKACSELITTAYRESFFSKGKQFISSVRAGNVIGGGDWNTDRIIPDCIRSLKIGEAIRLRAPRSTRPWQYVLEPLYGYLMLAAKMYEDGDKYSGAWNFGPNSNSVVSVEGLVSRVIDNWGTGTYKDVSEQSHSVHHEASLLMLDITKATNLLGWSPILDIDEAVKSTVNWYKNDTVNYGFCVGQIEQYLIKRGRSVF